MPTKNIVKCHDGDNVQFWQEYIGELGVSMYGKEQYIYGMHEALNGS